MALRPNLLVTVYTNTLYLQNPPSLASTSRILLGMEAANLAHSSGVTILSQAFWISWMSTALLWQFILLR